jgi:hypothetical protein
MKMKWILTALLGIALFNNVLADEFSGVSVAVYVEDGKINVYFKEIGNSTGATPNKSITVSDCYYVNLSNDDAITNNITKRNFMIAIVLNAINSTQTLTVRWNSTAKRIDNFFIKPL